MNTIQRLLTISALAMGAALPMAGHAQVSPSPGQVAAPVSDSMTDGEVKKVDPDNGKITLEPGKQGEIVWQFTKAGVVDFACLLPGHYEAGMKGAIKVGRK